MCSRRLTRLGSPGVTPTFDITPDGKQIVFDREILPVILPRINLDRSHFR
jgi:hypothetical protein